ncbi:hypothetical protein QBC35DRAFT_419950 [Podospora australis]|uniref:Uncharacterized protein n=1 Tax=Podospora australis TaxID=1536484 RepID=A0AAN6WMA0_9PEZI|nr:hypothetical protein QBC35DRAFT_419950 [Podospora australis]
MTHAGQPPPAYTPESNEKLIIALDFGTTYSGIAYCFASQRDPKVVSIVDWPGAEGQTAPKIPTLINYPDPNDNTKFSWGASVSKLQNNIVGVKLCLDPSQEKPEYLRDGLVPRTLQQLPKEPVDVAADFIGAIYKHALSEIQEVVPDDYFSICQKQFVLSVPAVWSDAAKNATMQAAKTAGIFPVTLIKEPEAAALHTMHSLDFSLKEGDAFVVCDAGGGTVDLVSYEVSALTPTLKLKEVAPGTGSMSGSLGLNERFADAVRDLVGEFEFDYLKKTKGYQLGMKSFELEVKRAFNGDLDEEYFVNFPMASLEDDPEGGLEANCWRMTGQHLKDIFAPLVHDIQCLVADQLKRIRQNRPGCKISGVFLVGGFGSNRYLKSCIQKQHPDVQVLQPSDAWAAIVKGAALSSLPQKAKIVSSSSTKHYGTLSNDRYDSVLDAGVPKVWDRHYGFSRAPRMTWYIKIGDDIQRDQRIKFPFYRSIDVNHHPDDLIFQSILYECVEKHAPLHEFGQPVHQNCTLVSDLRNIPRNLFNMKRGVDGELYYDVNFDLVITLKSALMEFSLEFDGKPFGTVSPKFT